MEPDPKKHAMTLEMTNQVPQWLQQNMSLGLMEERPLSRQPKPKTTFHLHN